MNWLRQRWKALLLDAALIIVVVGGALWYMTRDLPQGMAPTLEDVRTDGSRAKVGAGETAQLVVFWADWCPVCRAEEDNIESVASAWPVVSVAMQSGDAHAVKRYLTQRGLTTPAIVDPEGRHAVAWGVRGVPAHFIVDPAGVIRFRVVGYATTLGLQARLWWAQNIPA